MKLPVSREPKALPSQEELRRLFDYDADAGVLRWRHRPECDARRNNRFTGAIAGSPGGNGHLTVAIDGRVFLVHRLILKMLHNEEPSAIDHVDGNPANNRELNLRAATRSENMCNSRRRRRKPLPKGVFPGRGGHFFARIRKDNQNHHLGTFDTVEAAHAAYCAAARELHGEFARFN